MTDGGWTWITARSHTGTDAILASKNSDAAVTRFVERAQNRGAILEWVDKPVGRHWDGSKMTEADNRRYGA